MPSALSVSRLINVGVNLQPVAAQSQNVSNLLILGSSPVIDIKTRKRDYTSLAQIAADFGTNAPEYQAASLWFDQAPQPTKTSIGRWAQTASAGQLLGAALSLANTALGPWKAVTTGAFTITVDANAPQTLTGLNFSGITTLNGIASIINAVLTGATVVYNAVLNRFEVTSASTGAASIISFASAPGSGVDISTMLGLTAAAGAFQSNGIAAESAVSAVTLFDTNFGRQWYAVIVIGAATNDHLAIAPFIQGTTNKHFYGVTTQDPNTLISTDTTDVAYQLQQLALSKTAVQYSSTNPYAIASLLGRILTVDYTANNSVITLMYKQEPGVSAEILNETQAESLEGKNCNFFAEYDNSVAIIEPGVCSSGDFIDTVIGADVFAITIQTTAFNVLFQADTKIPQTDAGMHIITTAIEQICTEFEDNGFLGPGVWNEEGFGALQQGQFMPKGFYVFAPPIGNQNASDRSARLSVPIQVAAKLAGAVHKVSVVVTVNE
jgi:hypothetical protein